MASFVRPAPGLGAGSVALRVGAEDSSGWTFQVWQTDAGQCVEKVGLGGADVLREPRGRRQECGGWSRRSS